MTLRHMKIFVTVCQEKNITLAAKKLYISQPAVSIAIKEIENYYGIKLFDRLSRKIYITEVGKSVFNYAIHITALFDEMEKAIENHDESRKIKIGSSITIGVQLIPNYIKQFSALFPNVQTFVTIDSSNVIEQMVLDNQLDFALIEGTVHSENITSECFLDDELVVVCSLNNALLKKEVVLIEDLKSQKFLMREKNSGTRELAESILLFHNISIIPTWESSSTEAIINGLINGIGISILPLRLVSDYINDNRIGKINILDVNFKRQFNIIYHKNKFLTPVAKAFLKLCR